MFSFHSEEQKCTGESTMEGAWTNIINMTSKGRKKNKEVEAGQVNQTQGRLREKRTDKHKFCSPSSVIPVPSCRYPFYNETGPCRAWIMC